MHNLIPLNQEELNAFTGTRAGELRLGQTVRLVEGSLQTTLSDPNIKVVILGIPEDIGPRANMGLAGAEECWNRALHTFLNVQDNAFLKGNSICIAGAVRCEDLQSESNKLNAHKKEDLGQLRQLVSKLDQRVYEVAKSILDQDKLLIAVGGGHNNSYGLLKALSESTGTSVNCINLDPHADFRPLEGRHSGNGFSYAHEEGYLDKYFVLGMHESYNSSYILDQAHGDKFEYVSYDSMIHGANSFESALEKGISCVKGKHCGVEIDLDSIAHMPSSATSPSGIGTEEARRYLSLVSRSLNTGYIHIAEGAPGLHSDGNLIVGKTVAYLIADAIKNFLKKDA